MICRLPGNVLYMKYESRYSRSEKRSEEHTSELQSPCNLVCRLLLEKKKHLRPSHLHASLNCLRKAALRFELSPLALELAGPRQNPDVGLAAVDIYVHCSDFLEIQQR